jgi:hypothetical protein
VKISGHIGTIVQKIEAAKLTKATKHAKNKKQKNTKASAETTPTLAETTPTSKDIKEHLDNVQERLANGESVEVSPLDWPLLCPLIESGVLHVPAGKSKTGTVVLYACHSHGIPQVILCTMQFVVHLLTVK